MTTLHYTREGVIAIVKGSVEVLLAKLGQDQNKEHAFFQQKADEMAGKGYRVLGYAVKMFRTDPQNINLGEVEQELTLIGIAAMMDPPRLEAKEAIARCKAAGVTTVMITGDHKLTAKSIAERLGIISSDKDLVMEGHELRQLSEEQFIEKVEQVRVYARVDPDQKLRIIRALKQRHQFIAMTGDGVNDAPALRNADIGIAMGRTGTEVAKEAAHMILLDDNFATIVKAIQQGRRIFDNILKFIKYIMTGNTVRSRPCSSPHCLVSPFPCCPSTSSGLIFSPMDFPDWHCRPNLPKKILWSESPVIRSREYSPPA